MNSKLTTKPPHPLFEFWSTLHHEIADEYDRIRRRSIADPGTAGDEAEEHWAGILRNWLPRHYSIVTKGRIINFKGDVSPQVDLLILSPAYPRHLLTKKLYLADGVLAAFECKLTLDSRGLRKSIQNAVKIKRLHVPRTGSPYDELNQPIFFGVLAHSHAWSRASEDLLPLKIIERVSSDVYSVVAHPREMLDVLCVADAGTFFANKRLNVLPHCEEDFSNPEDRKYLRETLKRFDRRGFLVTGYMGFWKHSAIQEHANGEALGALIAGMTIRFGREDALVRPLATYFQSLHTWLSFGEIAEWSLDVLTPATYRKSFQDGPHSDRVNKWSDDCSDCP